MNDKLEASDEGASNFFERRPSQLMRIMLSVCNVQSVKRYKL